MVNFSYGPYDLQLYYFLACQQSKGPCIIALNNGGSEPPIRLSVRGRSCLAETFAEMFGLGIASKQNFVAYSAQFVLLIIRHVPEIMVMVVIDTFKKIPMMGQWIYRITRKHVYFNISVHFIVDTTSILKLGFPICLLFVSWQPLAWLYCCQYCCCCRYCNSYSYDCYHVYHHYCYFCY